LLGWPKLLVVLSIIILIGCIADMLVINDEWVVIKRRLFSASQKIKKSSLNDLMFLIANKIVLVLEGAVTIFSSSRKLEWLYSAVPPFLLSMTILFFYILFFKINYLISLILFIPIVAISIVWIVLIIFYEVITNKWSERFDNFWRIFIKTASISAIITFIALFLGSEMFSFYQISEFWFSDFDPQYSGTMKYAVYMGIINYPFDFLSLIFTYWCVKQISQKRGIFYVYPVLDVLFSAILSSFLYIVLYSISKSGFYFIFFPKELLILINHGPGKIGYDFIYLLPIVLTSFVPIFLLAVIFFLLTFYKVVSVFLSRFLHVLSEKEGSIFKDLSATISALIALINLLVG